MILSIDHHLTIDIVPFVYESGNKSIRYVGHCNCGWKTGQCIMKQSVTMSFHEHWVGR